MALLARGSGLSHAVSAGFDSNDFFQHWYGHVTWCHLSFQYKIIIDHD